jgi:molecular chaperone DnaJ
MAANDLFEKDFYSVLGVDKNADSGEIKKRYRALARDLHPDKTKGDSLKEERFKAVSEAYEVLSDAKKRSEYDQVRSQINRGGSYKSQSPSDFAEMFGSGNSQDFFSTLFGAGRHASRRGADLLGEALITFRESITGTKLDLQFDKDFISVRVPPGVSDGSKIRIKGKGLPGDAGPGDLIISLQVKPHPLFARNGANLTLTLPITFTEAALGCDIKVPTLSGDFVTLRITPGTPTGRTLRVKGRGILIDGRAGDLLVTVEVQVPQRVDGKALDALKKYAKEISTDDVRSNFNKMAKL